MLKRSYLADYSWEAHGFDQDWDWRHNFGKLRVQLQRNSAPLVGFTGSLQPWLVKALTTVLFSRVGRFSVENELACRSVLCNQDVDEAARNQLASILGKKEELSFVLLVPCHSTSLIPFIYLGVEKDEFSLLVLYQTRKVHTVRRSLARGRKWLLLHDLRHRFANLTSHYVLGSETDSSETEFPE
jgi:hypothetical protein